MILGVMPDDRFGERVLYSRPYYHRQLSAGRPCGRRLLPPANEPLAVEEGVAVRGLKGRRRGPYPSTEAVLEAVATAREKAGYVISTRGPWLAEQAPAGKARVPRLPSGLASVDRFPDRRGGSQVGPRI